MKYYIIESQQKKDYSTKLRVFEQQFTYPLGAQQFQIEHGAKSDNYFEFFDSLGHSTTFCVSKKGQIVATGTAILRTLNDAVGHKFWYLCDFKITKKERKKCILLSLLVRNFFKHYVQCQSMLAINMSPPNSNRLVMKIQRLFLFKRLNVVPIYLYQWHVDEFLLMRKKHPSLFEEYLLVKGHGIKDIRIDGIVTPIYHLAKARHANTNLGDVSTLSQKCLEQNKGDKHCMIMLVTTCPLIGVKYQSVGTAIHTPDLKLEDLNLSTFEI